ncbi:SusC/RagA family TonB-linked outer membrane protein [Rhodohalobacter sp. SW132]|uniref:SusC/RagA family TonB-linked outer membrane protein n=1 Tax=Rhodohalobacter sp. SW132 TaxID=2293433 RepID=UPI000E27194C|nr:SusC/RagA family TonB-linked outer membrane protein [Rhodohalobacter sp. SW132]REL32844.1 SusC/RagA family TonB-linked outer membrane protein [Rhodohalobacter sp. SW132]
MRIRRLIQNTLTVILFLVLLGFTPEVLEAGQVHTTAQAQRVTSAELQQKFYKADIEMEINITLEEETLDEALKQIATKTGLKLSYRGDIIDDEKVTLLSESISVSNALDHILEGTDLEYKISQDGYLLITKSNDVTDSEIYQETVTGTITDAQTGESLPGVNILIEGTNIGTSTNVDGEFSLSVPNLEVTLIISYIGYQSQEVELDGQSSLEIALQPAAVVGEELVVIGYGTMRQRDLTGSISSVQVEELNTVAQSSVNQMLQGRVPGLNMTTRSAQPGSGVTVNIRGAISSGGEAGNRPLYVIDGVPMTSYNSTVPGLTASDLGFGGGVDRDPLSFLNPSDIESISVMKDASAAAIYGSAAANGVILITTRGGRSGDLQVEYRGSYSIQSPKEYFPLLNERQFMEEQSRLSYDWYLYDHGLAPYGTNTTADVPFSPMYSESDISNAGAGTDWIDQVTRTGSIQEHNLVLSGGSDQTRLYGSFSFHDNQAILQNSRYTRYTARVNLDQTVSDAIEFRMRFNVGRQDGQNATSGSSDGGAEKFHMIEAATSVSPTIPVRNPDGSYAQHYNPLIMNPVSFMDIRDESETNNLFLAPTLEVNISENLRANITGQIDREGTTRGFYLPRSSNHALLSEGMAQKHENNRTNYTGETFLTYDNSFRDHSFTVMGGAGIYRAENSGFNVEANGFFTDAFQDFNIGVAHNLQQTRLGSYKNEQTKLSQFMRINYSYMDRYMLTLVGRRDGSSIFAENHRYGFFPGISAAWTLTEERFLREVDAISELKLRVGYGQSGNETVLAGNTLQLYSPGNQYVIGNTVRSGVALNQIANPDLTWETITTLNAGVDFGFLRNRIRGSLDVYQRTATDRLDYNPLPFNSPISVVADNVGSTQGYGVELSLSTLNIATPTVNWSTDFNISWSEARWLERNPRVPLDPWVGERDLLGTIYGVRTAGIIRSEEDIPAHQPNANLGNVIYVDENGDGVLDNEDIVILGNNRPKWSLGFRNNVAYRNFNLSVYVYGNLDFLRGNTYNPDPGALRVHGVPDNTLTNVSEVWSADNPDGWRPGVAPNPHSGDFSTGSDFNLYDASFIRIQDISLGYNLPQNVLSALGGIRSARVFFTVENIGVITNYPGFDPEFTEANPYPHAYNTSVGVDIRF